jgi:hypothetical protein
VFRDHPLLAVCLCCLPRPLSRAFSICANIRWPAVQLHWRDHDSPLLGDLRALPNRNADPRCPYRQHHGQGLMMIAISIDQVFRTASSRTLRGSSRSRRAVADEDAEEGNLTALPVTRVYDRTGKLVYATKGDGRLSTQPRPNAWSPSHPARVEQQPQRQLRLGTSCNRSPGCTAAADKAESDRFRTELAEIPGAINLLAPVRPVRIRSTVASARKLAAAVA